MVTVGHLLGPSESKVQNSCLVLRVMNKCHWETCVGEQGMKNPRVRWYWFILFPNCLLPPWHWGQGLEEAVGCYHENTHKGRGSDGFYHRRWRIPGRCPESPLSGQNAVYAWWNFSRVFLQHFGVIFQPRSQAWHEITTIIVWADMTSFKSGSFPRQNDSRLRTVLEKYQSLRRLKLETKWYRVWKPMK